MEILHTYTQAMDLFGIGFVALCVAIGTGILSWAFLDEKKPLRGIVCGTISVVLAVFVISLLHAYVTGGLDETYHEVLITDIAALDTYKYEIVEQRGKIFVIKEVAE